ncbi:hypothetical protein AX17_003972 [Amanita inopinata Kibby_2008]|nr:hypothetical protein AX17_003972 [Amanita inopinata Kibby_2008]
MSSSSSSSSSSAAAPASRSPSPHTPEASDPVDPITIQSDAEHTSSWFIPINPGRRARQSWNESLSFLSASKSEDDPMLRLDDLIEADAYHDTPSPAASSSQISSPQPHSVPQDSPSHDSPLNNHLVPSPVTSTKPAPPPPVLLRKPDPTSFITRVTHPPKEACFNLPIMFPSIPESGTKSRVETQIRVTVDLAGPSSSADPHKYDRVGSWKWLKLPPGTATKRRTRKQGKIDPEPQDTLFANVYVTCATAPHNRVFSCTSCQMREAKRVAKKLAARVRPARSDSESNDDPSHASGKSKQQEDTTSIIQFNCAQVLDFSTGSVVLPLRITCYCRHHREKVGFIVNVQMLDNAARVVALGQTRPIMITDDHKTASLHTKNTDFSHNSPNTETDWSQMGVLAHNIAAGDNRILLRRNKKDAQPVGKKRPKPYDSRAKPSRPSREGSASSLPSPSTLYSPLPGTRSPTPSNLLSQYLTPEPTNPLSSLRHSTNVSTCSSPDLLAHNIHTALNMFSEINVPNTSENTQQSLVDPQLAPTLNVPNATVELPSHIPHPHPIPLMFFEPSGASHPVAIHAPTIHRLIPNSGPTHGGIEVTVLGANFYSSLQLNCVFGGVPASSTQRWSDNTLVCILPPRSTPDVVAVWIDNFQHEQSSTATSLFTYSDESDRTLMELALQVVGLKMTGKIEDAKDVAMRIVGSAGDSTDPQATGSSSMMQLATMNSATTREILPLLLNRGLETEDFESLIVNFLALLDTPLEKAILSSMQTADAISHSSTTGQTLLHYAAFLGFDSLTRFLVRHNADLDARDRNGYTPLHFAALSGSICCAQILVDAGADVEIVNALGNTPAEIAQGQVLDALRIPVSGSDYNSLSDEEAAWGDGEDDADPQMLRRTSRRPSKRNLRRGISGRETLMHASVSKTPRATTPPPASDDIRPDQVQEQEKKVGADIKQTAWFVEVFQRTFAQLQAPQGFISNIPQLPFPHLPHFPDLSAAPWNSLPQIPIVFPVIVPMPGWPSFFQNHGSDKSDDMHAGKGMSAGALRTAQELRAMLEKWVPLAAAAATTSQQGQSQPFDDVPPPKYTPRAEAEGRENVSSMSKSSASTADCRDKMNNDEQAVNISRSVSSSEVRPVEYRQVQLTDQEVNSYAYRPSAKQTQKLKKKHDRMLIVFWLPILFLSCIWAFYSVVIFAFQAVKTVLPLKAPLRG